MRDNHERKGIHDSEKAKKHYTLKLYFTKRAEAERIINFFNQHFNFTLSLNWNSKKSGVMGRISYLNASITLYKGGESIATLLHEIAHYYDYSYNNNTGHGPSFKKAQDEILNIFDLNAHKLILGSSPTNKYHAARIIEKAKKSGSDILEELESYVFIEKTLNDIELNADEILNIILK